MKKFKINEHNDYDKSFQISSKELSLQVDYDDVNHPEVYAASRVLVEVLNQHWDEELFKEYYKEELTEQWFNNKDLHEKYETVEDFLKNLNL